MTFVGGSGEIFWCEWLNFLVGVVTFLGGSGEIFCWE